MLPFFGDINAVVGAFGFMPLDFVLPAVFFNLTFKPSKQSLIFWLNVTIAVVFSALGVIAAIAAVRYLDLHVRWNDLVRPDHNISDGKGSESEASVFRNAITCDKKTVQRKIQYGVAFGNQKHLPSRVMKNIIDTERTEDAKEKCWFHSTYIPLYLIKEYEERMSVAVLPSVKKPSTQLSDLQRRQLKASRRNVFAYLIRKVLLCFV
ncbi:hypothetical protein F3Y22_tig00110879pilonHSYRG00135 [Hibiscus syriacus]|uniref:Amino acid transporter transmembrane domain-containing protein n=1 Tax=Hibiscus syriacus TaxID=106335 RepID=A0A6A2ZJT7_HIBSY|nr:hypothetical protein F3Y22_tig00110879pilonHSYRG00135 [Hibiscus syriacus]